MDTLSENIKRLKNNLNIYDQMDWWDDRNTLMHQMLTKFDYFIEKTGDINGLKVLDVGCGGGLFTEKFAHYGAKVTGIDISPKSISQAQIHALEQNLEIDYKVGKAEALPTSDIFDIVICTDCLEHVDNLDKSISEISRLLKRDGLFLYDTINRNIISRISVIWVADYIFRRQLAKIGVTELNYTVHEWSKLIKPNELYELFKKYKLLNIETRGLSLAGIKRGVINTKIGENTNVAYIGISKKL